MDVSSCRLKTDEVNPGSWTRPPAIVAACLLFLPVVLGAVVVESVPDCQEFTFVPKLAIILSLKSLS